jgi:hypothetical protein
MSEFIIQPRARPQVGVQYGWMACVRSVEYSRVQYTSSTSLARLLHSRPHTPTLSRTARTHAHTHTQTHTHTHTPARTRTHACMGSGGRGGICAIVQTLFWPTVHAFCACLSILLAVITLRTYREVLFFADNRAILPPISDQYMNSFHSPS